MAVVCSAHPLWKRLLFRHIFSSLAVVFLLATAAILLYVSSLQADLVETSAVQNAKLYSEAIGEFRTLYTSEVVARVRGEEVKVTDDYAEREHAIPLSATLSMLLGRKIGEPSNA